MRITKGQLKRIIAEEYALVYGKPKSKTSNRTSIRRRRLQEQKLLEARKRDLLLEAKAKLIVEEFMMKEGFFDRVAAGLSGLFGGEGGIADQIGGAIEKASNAIQTSAEKAKAAMNKAIEAQKEKEKQEALKAMQDSVGQEGGGAFYRWASEHVKKCLNAGLKKEDILGALTSALPQWQKAATTNMNSMSDKLK